MKPPGKQMKGLPNKVLRNAYDKAKGKVFRYSPSRQVFIDEQGNEEYDFHAMVWLMYNNYLIEKPFDSAKLVTEFYIE